MTSTQVAAAAATHGERNRRLTAGIVAGPLFVLASFAQIPFRDGFDLTRHAFSFLLLGPGGWLQTVNFVVTGVLFLVSGVGLRAVVGRAAQLAASGLGVGAIIGGLFAPDPSYGYPVGAPVGMPDPITYRSVVHGIGFVTAMICWCVLLLVLGRWLWRRGRPGPAALSLVTGVALLAVPAVTGRPFATVFLYVVATAGYLVTSVLFARVRAEGRERIGR